MAHRSQPSAPDQAPTATLDLDDYLSRINWSGQRTTDWAVLRSLHLSHTLAVPFENASVVLGEVPSLSLADLQTKIVRAGRGGYCFEQNTLFAAVLERFGFGVRRLAARVLAGAGPEAPPRPRTHMLLLVSVPGRPQRYLADVGFGALGLLEPMPLVAGAPSPQGVWRYELAHGEGPYAPWVLRTLEDGQWQSLYSFTLQPQEPIDYQVANWYVATHPSSPFTSVLRVQRHGRRERLSLTGRTLAHTVGKHTRESVLADDAAVLRTLATEFGIVLPTATRFPGSD